MNNRTIPSELTLCVNGVETLYTVDANFSYRGANCDVFAAISPDGERVIIKRFRFVEGRERDIGIIRRLSERYGLAGGNYFMGFCYETNRDGQSSHPYCHVFRRINGNPLQNSELGAKDHAALVHTLQTFLGFLEGVALLHDMGYAHWDIKPSNIYSFQATPRDPLIVQLIDFDTAVDCDCFSTPNSTKECFEGFEMDAKSSAMFGKKPWYFSHEIRQAQKLLSEDNALALAQSLDLAACARILAYMIIAPQRPVSMSLDEINRRLRNASMDLGTKNALRRFFRRALHEDFAKRFAACSEMQAYLEQVLEGLDENRDVTSLYALRIRLGNYESKSGEAQKFFKQLDTDILSEFRDDKRSYESLRDVLADKPSCVLITGEGGIGKTYALRDEYYRRLYAEDENADVALYVELKGMKAVEEITAKLDEIRRDLRATGLRVPYSVFLDAFDESLMDRDKEKDKSRGKKEYKGDSKDEFLSYLSKLQKECRVVVTCRHHIESTQSGLGENPVFSSVVSTVGLRDEQIELYLEKKRLYLNVQSQNAPLVQLLKNPLMLWLFADGWDKAREPKDQAEFLRVTNEVELIEQYIWKCFDVKDHTPDYTFENYQTGLTLVALCLYSYDSRIADMKSDYQDLIDKALRNLGPVAVLSEGKITCTHQVFADYFSGLAFAAYYETLYRKAKEHTDRKGLPTAKSRNSYAEMLEVAAEDWHYEHDSDDARRFQGIMIARGEPEAAGNIYERLEARTRTVFEYIDWLDRSERKAIGVLYVWFTVSILGRLLFLIIYLSNREYLDAMLTSMSFLQRCLLILPNSMYWIFGAWFVWTYVTQRTVAFATASNYLFSILCHCQRYGDGEVCVMPPTVSECLHAELDPRCKKMILGRDCSGRLDGFFSHAVALEEIDCSHTRRFCFEEGCLYYKKRKLEFIVRSRDSSTGQIHVPKGVTLKEASPFAYNSFWGKQFIQLSCEGRIAKGGFSELRLVGLPCVFIFAGTKFRWKRVTRIQNPFFIASKRRYRWSQEVFDRWEKESFNAHALWLLDFLVPSQGELVKCGLSSEEAESLENRLETQKKEFHFFYTLDEPNVSRVIHDTDISEKAYIGSTEYLDVSCPAAESVGHLAFAYSTVREIELPVCRTVGAHAFRGAKRFVRIHCPQVEVIEKGAFCDIDSFSGTKDSFRISLPSCKRIGDEAFEQSGLAKIHVPLVEYIGDLALRNDDLKTVHLPSCRYIGERAFWGNETLCHVTLSNKLEFLGSGVFNDCDSLTEITFAGTVAEWQAVEKEGEICDHPLLIRCTDGDWTEIPPGR